MRICIVDDDQALLGNLSLLLSGERGMAVVGAHGSAETALQKTDWSQVELLLADIELPGKNGVELIRAVKAINPHIQCMAHTVHDDRPTVFEAIKAGACGYLLKGTSPRELVESLRALHDGGAPMSPSVARKVIMDIQAPREPDVSTAPPLTARESELLKLLERGSSYKEVSETLHISVHTVHSHIKNIYEKVHAKTRDEALRKARNLGAL
ncbi:MAG: response regulator transcription factor [Deltaproteobacteria bacterium]|nr:response regulator transcription factor [Deltaproteobacteria bacterium]